MANVVPSNVIANYPIDVIDGKATGRFTFPAVRYFQQLENRVSNLEQPPITTPSATYTMIGDNHIIMGNTTAGSFSVILDSPVGLEGGSYLFKNIGTANIFTLDGNGSLIDPGLVGGGATYALGSREAVLLVPNNDAWYIMAKYT